MTKKLKNIKKFNICKGSFFNNAKCVTSFANNEKIGTMIKRTVTITCANNSDNTAIQNV